MSDPLALDPIVLTEFGDTLVETAKAGIHTSELEQLQFGGLGIHQRCGKPLKLRYISETHDAICCHHCLLRVPFPNHIRTYQELRRHFQELSDD